MNLNREEIRKMYLELAVKAIEIIQIKSLKLPFCKKFMEILFDKNPKEDGAMEVLNIQAFSDLQEKRESVQNKAELIIALANFIVSI